MIKAIYQLALDYLYFNHRHDNEPETPGEWYSFIREKDISRIFPFLVEASRGSMANNFYILFPAPHDKATAILEKIEFSEEHLLKLPFVQSTGSQSAALGPVIKRTYSGNNGGPSKKILRTTIEAFKRKSKEGNPWSEYFNYVTDVLTRPKIQFLGITHIGSEDEPAIMQAVNLIPEKNTAFLTVMDENGKLPGERDDYKQYLMGVLAKEKYSTAKFIPIENGVDAITGKKGVVYPNALNGAGININNMDRMGVFSMLEPSNAWKKFALSEESADLLYLFSFHIRDQFIGRVAGERALIIPDISIDINKRKRFTRDFKEYIAASKKSSGLARWELSLSFFAEKNEIAGITIIWADFGQKMENLKGVITDILPSRLTVISNLIRKQRQIKSPVFPIYPINNCELDLNLNGFANLLKRPGGKRNENINKGLQLFNLKRQIASALYHEKMVDENLLWKEILTTAKEYLIEAQKSGNSFGLTNEGLKSNGEVYLTSAGWVKHIAQYLDFFRKAGVLEDMSCEKYIPKRAEILGFFEDANSTTGLDSKEKVYAFLIGVLFGKLLVIQAARGVNVTSNALTWLKRLSLTPKDLPELYVKIREKLFSYQDKSKGSLIKGAMNAVIEEIGWLGIEIGTPCSLSSVETNYYLLLGQSLSNVLIPPSKKKEGENDDE